MDTISINKVQIGKQYDFDSDALTDKVSGNKLNLQTDYMNFYFCPKYQTVNIFLTEGDKLSKVSEEIQKIYEERYKEISKKFNCELMPLVKSYINKSGENVSYVKFSIKKCLVFDSSGKKIPLPQDMKGYQMRISFVVSTFMMNKKNGVSLKPLQIQLKKRPLNVQEVMTECLFD
jgi:hypothetical protein